MFLPKRGSARQKQRDAERAEFIRRVRAGEYAGIVSDNSPKAKVPSEPLCPVHWRETAGWEPRMPGAPKPACPYCIAAAAPVDEPYQLRELPALSQVHATSRLDAAWEAHLRRTGQMQPNSLDEKLALGQIDDARKEAREREAKKRQSRHQRGARIVSQRIEGGQLVQFIERPAPWIGARRKQLVKLTP
jgi:hypothetical protein